MRQLPNSWRSTECRSLGSKYLSIHWSVVPRSHPAADAPLLLAAAPPARPRSGSHLAPDGRSRKKVPGGAIRKFLVTAEAGGAGDCTGTDGPERDTLNFVNGGKTAQQPFSAGFAVGQIVGGLLRGSDDSVKI